VIGTLVYNSLDYTYQQEKLLDQLKKKEQQTLKDSVNSYKIVNGDTVLISTSVTEFSGEI